MTAFWRLLVTLLLLSGCTGPDPTVDAGEDWDSLQETDGRIGVDTGYSDDRDGGTAQDGRTDSATDDGGNSNPDDNFNPYAVVSLNLHCFKLDGTSFANNDERFGAIAQVMASENVSVLLLQEACRNQNDDAMAHLAAALGSATGEQWSQAWMPAHIAWEGTQDEAEEGVGVLVRGELVDVGQFEFFSQSSLRRVAIGARVGHELGGLWLWSTHLAFADPARRLPQARQAAATPIAWAWPSHNVVVGGDFNDTPDSPTCAAMKSFGFLDMLAGLDPQRIDQLYAHRGAAITVLHRKILFDGITTPVVSDHPGVLALLGPDSAPQVADTRIVAHLDVGYGNFLSVRGDRTPLSWDAGWPALPLASDTWMLVITEIPGGQAFEYKFLLNDTDYEVGTNHSGVGGSMQEVTPTF